MDGASKFVRGDAVAGILILLINIFGGILRCDVLAAGVIAAVKELGVPVPITATLYAVLKAWESGPVKS